MDKCSYCGREIPSFIYEHGSSTCESCLIEKAETDKRREALQLQSLHMSLSEIMLLFVQAGYEIKFKGNIIIKDMLRCEIIDIKCNNVVHSYHDFHHAGVDGSITYWLRNQLISILRFVKEVELRRREETPGWLETVNRQMEEGIKTDEN